MYIITSFVLYPKILACRSILICYNVIFLISKVAYYIKSKEINILISKYTPIGKENDIKIHFFGNLYLKKIIK